MRARALAVVWLVLSACSGGQGPAGPQGPQGPVGARGATGSPGADAAMPSAGSRITVRASSWLGADGSRSGVGYRFHDAALGVDCELQLGADGVSRCLPSAPSGTVGDYYADAACTVAVALGDAACPPRFATITVAPQACGGARRLRVFPVAAEVTGPLYAMNGAAPPVCDPLAARPDPGAGMTWYALGAELAATEFVAFTAQ